MHAVVKDTLLQRLDEYVIERDIIKQIFPESYFRSTLLGYNLYHRITNYTEYPQKLTSVDEFINSFNDETGNINVKEQIEDIYRISKSNSGSLEKGSIAPKFNLPDQNGKSFSISDFKGKLLYIDFWATWCRPCLAEMPPLQELREKYKNTDLQIISISVDTYPDRWKERIANMHLGGLQLIEKNGSLNSKIAQDYNVNGLPHYILIDKKGRIISPFAPRPSEKAELEKQLDTYLNK
jgi:thiol-disulfide isomerase/thioredoxin